MDDKKFPADAFSLRNAGNEPSVKSGNFGQQHQMATLSPGQAIPIRQRSFMSMTRTFAQHSNKEPDSGTNTFGNQTFAMRSNEGRS